MKGKNSTNAKRTAIVFIDGNNFYHCLRKTDIAPRAIDFYKLSKMVCECFNFEHKKTIYYNSVPDISDGKETFYKHIKFLDELKKLPQFEVKIRKLQKLSTHELREEQKRVLPSLGLCEKCKTIIEQHYLDNIGHFMKKEKGIDVMIAVDMLEGSIKNKYDCAILISGDADLVPALNLTKNNGKEVRSAFLYYGYSSELRKTHPYFVLKEELLKEKCLKY